MFPTPPRLGWRAGGAAGWVLAVAVTVATFAFTPAALASAPTSGDPCAQAPTPGDSQVSLDIGGRERDALIHVPPAAAGQSLPLVVALHSGGGLGPWFESYTGFSQIADAEGFIVIYPNGAGYQHFWTINDHNPTAPDDVGFVNSLLDQAESSYCINPTRVYAFGVSNGGGMAVRLGCELASRFAAIATIAGGYRSQPSCNPAVPISVLEVHGTSDGSVPYDGMPPDHAGSVPLFLRRWVARDRCRRAPARRRIGVQALRLDWTACAGGAAIEHIEIIGGGHQLPGAMPPDKGPRSTISVPWLVWSFLRSHLRVSLPAATAPPAGAPGSTPPVTPASSAPATTK